MAQHSEPVQGGMSDPMERSAAAPVVVILLCVLVIYALATSSEDYLQSA